MLRMLRRKLLSIGFEFEYVVSPAMIRSLLRTRQPSSRSHHAPTDKRVLYVAASALPYHISGYATRTAAVVSAMESSGLSVAVTTRAGYPWDRSDSLVQAAENSTCVDGVLYQHARNPTRNRPIVAYALQGSRVIERMAVEHNASVIHAASNYANALPALFAARRLGVPFHYEMRGIWELSRASFYPDFKRTARYKLGMELESLVAKRADKIYVISDALGRFVSKHLGVDHQKMSLLPNCVDPNHIFPTESSTVSAFTIGYAGSLLEYEGLDTLLDAVSILVHQNVKVKLRIVGDGRAKDGLVARASFLGLDDIVEFLGRQTPGDAREVLSQCALVCIPRKPFEVCKIVPPIKLVEALALGKAVIVPDLPVFRDELGEDPPALFFKAGDADDLASVIFGSLGNTKLLVELGRSARRYACENRSWCNFFGQI